MTRLTILIPFYNEQVTLPLLLAKVVRSQLSEGISKEIILVDDASTDDSRMQIQHFIDQNQPAIIKVISHAKNMGKGAAIHTGIQHATGDYVIVQDADLEYDPRDYSVLLQPILEGEADVVYGSRFMGGNPHRILFFWHSLGNAFLTFLSNAFTNLNLTDMETGYKVFHTETLRSLNLRERRFGFEPEVTAKISRVPGIRIYEVGISYYGRTYGEGKKINWKDGFRAIYCILRYNLFN